MVEVAQLIDPLPPREKQHLTLVGLVSHIPLMYKAFGHKAVSIHLNIIILFYKNIDYDIKYV